MGVIALLFYQRRLTILEQRCISLSDAREQQELRLQLVERENKELNADNASLNTLLETEREMADEKAELLFAARQELKDTFKSVSADALQNSSEAFITLANQVFEKYRTHHQMNDQMREEHWQQAARPLIEALKRMDDHLRLSDQERQSSIAALREQTDMMRLSHKGLADETRRLSRAFRQPTVRGRWGEIQLRRVVELAGMVPYCDFDEQPSVETEEGTVIRPDLLVRLPGDRCLVVDSKVPLDAYLQALEVDDDTQYAELMKKHAQRMELHIQQLSNKSYGRHIAGSPDFVVLFLPSEAFLSAALAIKPELMERAMQKGIIPSSPATLMALLRSAAYGWSQDRLNDNVAHIATVASQLLDHLHRLISLMNKTGRHMRHTTDDFNAALVLLEQEMLPGMKDLEMAGTAVQKKFPDLRKVTQYPAVSQNERNNHEETHD